ncbi:MAG: nitroreductase family protein, partial [Pseudomonadota bacterium]
MTELFSALQSHRSIRKFSDKPIAGELFEQLILCGQAAATSSFVQSVSVIRVSDATLRNQLA